MSALSLIINSVPVALQAAEEIEQRYEDFGGFAALRFANGAGLVQQAWRKTRTSIAASGLVPPGLDAMNWTQPFTLACIEAKSTAAASNVITLPAARRTDAPPYGFALLPTGQLQPVALTLAGNVATLGTVAGAVAYQAHWYPLLTVIAPDGLRHSTDANGAVVSWELTAEEV